MTTLLHRHGTGSSTGSDAMVPEPYRVIDRRAETADTVTLTLLPIRPERAVARFRPGQFTMLSVSGVGEIPVSVSGNPDDQRGGRLVQTVRDVGAVSGALCRTEPGGRVGVRGPFGRGWRLGSATGEDLLVIAGGIGLAPLRPLIMTAMDYRERFRDLTLIVGARSRADLLFPRQLDVWAESGELAVEVTLDSPPPDWRGGVGLVTGPLSASDLDVECTNAFVCGPEVMIRVCAESLIERGVPAHKIQVSLERNMKCGIGWCGRCQLGPFMLCRNGPVLGYDLARELLAVKEL